MQGSTVSALYASWSIDHFPQQFRQTFSIIKRLSVKYTVSFFQGGNVVVQVSQSHDLLAQILQLSSSLPADWQSSGGKFAPILFEFQFFRDPDAHERKIEASQELTDLDEEFREVKLPSTMHTDAPCQDGFIVLGGGQPASEMRLWHKSFR